MRARARVRRGPWRRGPETVRRATTMATFAACAGSLVRRGRGVAQCCPVASEAPTMPGGRPRAPGRWARGSLRRCAAGCVGAAPPAPRHGTAGVARGRPRAPQAASTSTPIRPHRCPIRSSTPSGHASCGSPGTARVPANVARDTAEAPGCRRSTWRCATWTCRCRRSGRRRPARSGTGSPGWRRRSGPTCCSVRRTCARAPRCRSSATKPRGRPMPKKRPRWWSTSGCARRSSACSID